MTLALVRKSKDKDKYGNAYTTTWFDMFRVANGKNVEHWDTAKKPQFRGSSACTERADSPNRRSDACPRRRATWVAQTTEIPRTTALDITTLTILTFLAVLPIAAWVSDRVGMHMGDTLVKHAPSTIEAPAELPNP